MAALTLGNRFPPKRSANASASSGFGKAEHLGVAAIAAQGVRERRRRENTDSAKYHLTFDEAPNLSAGSAT
jgi:hypothetical protein